MLKGLTAQTFFIYMGGAPNLSGRSVDKIGASAPAFLRSVKCWVRVFGRNNPQPSAEWCLLPETDPRLSLAANVDEEAVAERPTKRCKWIAARCSADSQCFEPQQLTKLQFLKEIFVGLRALSLRQEDVLIVLMREGL